MPSRRGVAGRPGVRASSPRRRCPGSPRGDVSAPRRPSIRAQAGGLAGLQAEPLETGRAASTSPSRPTEARSSRNVGPSVNQPLCGLRATMPCSSSVISSRHAVARLSPHICASAAAPESEPLATATARSSSTARSTDCTRSARGRPSRVTSDRHAHPSDPLRNASDPSHAPRGRDAVGRSARQGRRGHRDGPAVGLDSLGSMPPCPVPRRRRASSSVACCRPTAPAPGLGLTGWTTSGVPDEWVGADRAGAVPDPLLHGALLQPRRDRARRGRARRGTGHRVGGRRLRGRRGRDLGPKGSFALPDDARWLLLVGDLTGLPALARIHEWVAADAPGLAPRRTSRPEGPDGLPGPARRRRIRWLEPPGEGDSALAEVVRGIGWPEGHGYFWMAGESAQMRDIRRHLCHEVGSAAGPST